MLRLFDRIYPRILFFGLVSVVWLAVLCRAGHDLWAASLLFGLITFLTVVFCAGRFRDQHPIKIPLLYALLSVLGAFCLSIQNSYDFATTHQDVWGWFFIFLAFYLFINVVHTTEDAERFFVWAGLIVIPVLLHCIWQRWVPAPGTPGEPATAGLFGYGSITVPLAWIHPQFAWTIRYGHWEIHATLINSVVMAGCMLHWVLLYWKKTLQERRYAVLFLACVAVLGFARSWWAFAVLGVGCAFYYRLFLQAWVLEHKKTTLLLAGLFLLPAFLVLYTKFHHQPEGMTSTTSYHGGSRGYYALSALKMLRHHPAAGVGLGGFATAYPYFKAGAVENTRAVHNFPLQLVTETGLAGAAALIVAIWSYWMLRRENPPQGAGASSASLFDAILLMIVIYGLFSIHMDYFVNKLLFMLVLASTLVTRPMKNVRVKPLWTASCAAALLLIVPFWLSLFWASRLHAAGWHYEKEGDIAKAVELYQKAIDVEDIHAESYWRLAKIYEMRYAASRSPEDAAVARFYAEQAIRYKKDVHFFANHAQAGRS
jgi:hypothetical protein